MTGWHWGTIVILIVVIVIAVELVRRAIANIKQAREVGFGGDQVLASIDAELRRRAAWDEETGGPLQTRMKEAIDDLRSGVDVGALRASLVDESFRHAVHTRGECTCGEILDQFSARALEWHRIDAVLRLLHGRAEQLQPTTYSRSDQTGEARSGDIVEVTYIGWVDKEGWIRSRTTQACLLAPPHPTAGGDADEVTVRVLHRAQRAEQDGES